MAKASTWCRNTNACNQHVMTSHIYSSNFKAKLFSVVSISRFVTFAKSRVQHKCYQLSMIFTFLFQEHDATLNIWSSFINIWTLSAQTRYKLYQNDTLNTLKCIVQTIIVYLLSFVLASRTVASATTELSSCGCHGDMLAPVLCFIILPILCCVW